MHGAAARIFDEGPKTPTPLHRDLLRLFGSAEKVRVVTTNFDTLFEMAAAGLWPRGPEVFTAPALPRGAGFTGIVKLHGSTQRPEEMILTDADFSRAYLIEGWARQFLVDLFYHNTVVFVGYGHNDTAMQYLTRGLPAERVESRFGLTAENRVASWKDLDIPPITFPQPRGEEDFSALTEGVRRLADFYSAGLPQWQERIRGIAQADPALSPEAGEQVLALLPDPARARLFAEHVTAPCWLGWLDAQGRLAPLFAPGSLNEQADILARWVADRFLDRHPAHVIRLFAGHGGLLNPALWQYALQALDRCGRQMDAGLFRRLVLMLLACVPEGKSGALTGLAALCAARDEAEGLARVFLTVSGYRLAFAAPEGEENGARLLDRPDAEPGALNAVYRLTEPFLPRLHPRLMEALGSRLEQLHRALAFWDGELPGRDPVAGHRPQVFEPGPESSGIPPARDALLEVFGRLLLWTCAHAPGSAARWLAHRGPEDAPVLQRAALAAARALGIWDADARLAWLTTGVDLGNESLDGELAPLLATCYPRASAPVREDFLRSLQAVQPVENAARQRRRGWPDLLS